MEQEQFKFGYSSIGVTFDADFFLKLADNYAIDNPLPIAPGFEEEVNVVCKIDVPSYQTLDEVRSKISNQTLLNYLEPIITEAEDTGIKNVTQFRVWIQGNNQRLTYPSSKLSAHTHPYGDITEEGIVNTYTVIIPLVIEKESVTEYFWAKWVDRVEKTVTSKLKLLNSNKLGASNRGMTIPAFHEWWNKIKTESLNEQVIVKFPNKDEKLILDFDSKSYVHGVENIGNNMYLLILFDRYKK